MAEKKAATAATKAAKTPVKGRARATAKATVKKKVAKGESYACEVCGLGVSIEEIGDLVVEEDSVLLCCGKPMKKKAAVKKAAVKKAVKK